MRNPIRSIRHLVRYLICKPQFRKYVWSDDVRDISDVTCGCVSLGRHVRLGKRCRIQGVRRYGGAHFNPDISFGDFVSVEQDFYLTCASRISIGDNTAIAAFVTITDIDHPYQNSDIPVERQDISVGEVSIGPDCKIYNGAVILKDTHIGRHCVIGANSVVKGVFPDFCVIAGAPARVVRRYNPEKDVWERPLDK